MTAARYDCAVVGSGPGGYVAAIRASQLGLRTAVVEGDRLGGRCLNYACIPAKALLRAADALSDVHAAKDHGIASGDVRVDFGATAARRRKVISVLTGGVRGLLEKHGVELIAGRGTLTAGGEIALDDSQAVSARLILLASGSVPRALDSVPFGRRVLTTEAAWSLDQLPRSIAVAGAGPSGVEVASAFARLGSSVVLLEAQPRVLPEEDEEIAAVVARLLAKQGVDVRTGAAVETAVSGRGSVEIQAGGETLKVERLVVAVGRRPDTADLGLEEAGVARDGRGMVAVDGSQRTSAEGVYAIGDLVPGPALAHKASEEGIVAVEHAAGRDPVGVDHSTLPTPIFSRPAVASFGLTERQARNAGYDVVVGRASYGAVGAVALNGDRTGLVKIVGDRRYGEILGGHVVGAKAIELIQQLVNVKALEGGFAELACVAHGHPTLSEAVLEAARSADGWLVHG